MIRKLLIRIRKEYNTRLPWLLKISVSIFLTAALAGFLLDFLAPFTGFWNVLRSIVLMPLASSIFVLGYVFAIYQHRKRVAMDPEWVPFRSRFSQRWRINISAIIGAIIFVFIYGMGFSKAYTLMSSAFVALIFSLFVFMRATHDESKREKLGVPDTRDLQYDAYKRKLQEARLKAKENKKSKESNEDEDE